MVTSNPHGGSCCGAKHIRGFSGGDREDANELPVLVAGNINGQAQEVILNGTQVAEKPLVLARLAELGFVLDGHWHNGNHGVQTLTNNATDANLGSHCYRFTRMDRRKALNEGPIAGRWAGMVMTPGLTGNLRQMNGTAGGDRAHYTRPLPRTISLYAQAGGMEWMGGVGAYARRGDTVEVINHASRRFGRRFTVLNITGNDWDRRYVMHDDLEGVDFTLVGASIVLRNRAEQPANVFTPVVGTRVQWKGQSSYSGEVNNGEFGTITRINWPHIGVQWDRPSAPRHYTNLHAQYFYAPQGDGIVPLIQPPVAPPPEPQLHAEAEVLTVRPENPAAIVEVAPPVVTVLFRTYHNVYRDGRVGAGYDTYAAALDGRRATGRVDRREYLSDGTTRMVENVEE